MSVEKFPARRTLEAVCEDCEGVHLCRELGECLRDIRHRHSRSKLAAIRADHPDVPRIGSGKSAREEFEERAARLLPELAARFRRAMDID